MHIVQCTVYIVQYALHTMYSVNAKCIVHCTVLKVHCTVYDILHVLDIEMKLFKFLHEFIGLKIYKILEHFECVKKCR